MAWGSREFGRLSVLLAVAGLGLVLLSTPPRPAIPGGGQAAAAGEADPQALSRAPAAGSQAGESEAAGQNELGQGVSSDAVDLVSFGRALFQAKGCTACHQHGEVNPGDGVGIGPDLTDRVLDPGFLRSWLSDPAAIRPGTQMPDLGLSEAEIEALIAFLNHEPD